MRIQKPADLARIVKTQRQAQQLTQQQVADVTGITRQSLARIEGGHAGASFASVLRIFEYLGIQLEGNSSAEGANEPSLRFSEWFAAQERLTQSLREHSQKSTSLGGNDG